MTTAAYIQHNKSFGLIAILIVAVAYLAFGAMGLSLAIPPGYASPIFVLGTAANISAYSLSPMSALQ